VYLIETSTCVSILRSRLPGVVSRLRAISPDDLAVSSITAAELFHGASRSHDPQAELRRVRSLIEVLNVMDFGIDAAISYGVIRGALERGGEVIGQFDLLIAGHAVSLGATIVTHNTREFRRVQGLVVEDWAA
jgi:tRNA(fMet)-specific endonuclease VapC